MVEVPLESTHLARSLPETCSWAKALAFSWQTSMGMPCLSCRTSSAEIGPAAAATETSVLTVSVNAQYPHIVYPFGRIGLIGRLSVIHSVCSDSKDVAGRGLGGAHHPVSVCDLSVDDQVRRVESEQPLDTVLDDEPPVKRRRVAVNDREVGAGPAQGLIVENDLALVECRPVVGAEIGLVAEVGLAVVVLILRDGRGGHLPGAKVVRYEVSRGVESEGVIRWNCGVGDVGRPVVSQEAVPGFSRGIRVGYGKAERDRRVRRDNVCLAGQRLCQGVVLTKLLIVSLNGLEGYPSRGEARGLQRVVIRQERGG